MKQADISGDTFGDLTALRPVDRRDGNIVWTCLCSCGGTALRTVRQLRASVRQGNSPACRECIASRRRARFGNSLLVSRAFWRERWEEYGSLYPFGGPEDAWCDDPEEEVRTTVPAGFYDDSGATAFADNEHTLEEVADEFAMSRENVRRIEAKALRKLRHPLRSRFLREFIGDDTDERFSHAMRQLRAERETLAREERESRQRKKWFIDNRKGLAALGYVRTELEPAPKPAPPRKPPRSAMAERVQLPPVSTPRSPAEMRYHERRRAARALVRGNWEPE